VQCANGVLSTVVTVSDDSEVMTVSDDSDRRMLLHTYRSSDDISYIYLNRIVRSPPSL
jgi:hypothetical protein